MATFTKNAWVTGETITADGLNGGKGVNVLEIGPDDFYDGSVEFEIEIATGLSAIDFLNTSVSCPQVDGVATSPVNRVVSTDNYLAIGNYEVDMYYYPETGILTTSIPSPDGGDNDGDGDAGVS